MQIHCDKGHVPGVNLLGKAWQIPAEAVKPKRQPRQKQLPSNVLAILKAEKRD